MCKRQHVLSGKCDPTLEGKKYLLPSQQVTDVEQGREHAPGMGLQCMEAGGAGRQG